MFQLEHISDMFRLEHIVVVASMLFQKRVTGYMFRAPLVGLSPCHGI